MGAFGVWMRSAILLIGQTGAGPPIFGAVVDPTGRPVAGAEVVLTSGASPDGSVPILAKTTTDASRGFRLDRPSAEHRRGFLPRAHRTGQNSARRCRRTEARGTA